MPPNGLDWWCASNTPIPCIIRKLLRTIQWLSASGGSRPNFGLGERKITITYGWLGATMGTEWWWDNRYVFNVTVIICTCLLMSKRQTVGPYGIGITKFYSRLRYYWPRDVCGCFIGACLRLWPAWMDGLHSLLWVDGKYTKHKEN